MGSGMWPWESSLISPCLGFHIGKRALRITPLGHFAIHDIKQTVAVDKKAAGTGNVTKSIWKAQKATWVFSITPATSVLLGSGKISELLASIGHLTLLGKRLVNDKTFTGKGIFWGPFFCPVCGSFKLLVFKNQYFKNGNNLTKKHSKYHKRKLCLCVLMCIKHLEKILAEENTQ